MTLMNDSLNVFNEPLLICGTSPMTGAYRDGCCNTGVNDRGTHSKTLEYISLEELLKFEYQPLINE